ncbi:hypothetical protein EV201_0437 [Ancylomarina subtilis]|uniref:Uncharacterized protein n=1 Tax=Ancylomarina subtilis TaxID=1639035 RepID=A0A4Q7VI64_9BACT|nr:hypothetical protein [Ancylomarina subtilis]RZT95811.1 hypothetical protein EV201_0437 [Ancylomarina subtilis]
MRIYIDHTPIETFKGAQLADALLSYSKDCYKQLQLKQIWLEDERGNRMEADGRLWEDIELFIKHKTK